MLTFVTTLLKSIISLYEDVIERTHMLLRILKFIFLIIQCLISIKNIHYPKQILLSNITFHMPFHKVQDESIRKIY